jgi:hypothetical protein
VDHDPHRAVVAIDLQLDEVVPAAHRAELRAGLVVGARDRLDVDVVRDGDERPLAEVGGDAERGGAAAQRLLDELLGGLPHLLGRVGPHAGRDP